MSSERRGVAALVVAFSLCIAGCSTTPSKVLDARLLGNTDIKVASGVGCQEILGIYFIRTLSYGRGGVEVDASAFRPIHSVERGDWRVDFFAPESALPAVAEWMAKNGAALNSSLEAMFRLAETALPGDTARRFEIYVFPPDTNLDLGWRQVVTRESDVKLRFAMRLPTEGDDGESVVNTALMLIHEHSHAYFWFHRKNYVNNFSDEVVAYTLQRCLHEEIHGGPIGALGRFAGAFELMEREIRALPVEGIYGKFGSQYPDTFLANAVAAALLERESGDAQGVPAICKTIAASRRDFTGVR